MTSTLTTTAPANINTAADLFINEQFM